MEEASEWSKLPIVLQHQFFAHAEEAAKRCRERIKRQVDAIRRLKGILKFRPIEGECGELRVASVDGSWLPARERAGIRAGIYAAGYMVFEGDQLVEENYKCEWLTEDQVGEPRITNIILSLLCVKLEREAALRCLKEEDVDLVLIDGNFYGFRARCSEIMDRMVGVEGFSRGEDLVKRVRDLTTTLAKSGRCVGVAKRVRIAAIDGWILKNLGEKHCVGQNDKMILTLLMPPRTWFSYEDLLGEGATWLDCLRYSILRRVYEEYKEYSLDYLWNRWVIDYEKVIFRKNLACAPEDLPTLMRYFIRCCEAPPFCLEVPAGVDLGVVLPYLVSVHNPATGLPLPIDLIDENVTLPDGLSREFVEEVEAALLRDSGGLSEDVLMEWFSSINPQKEE